MYSNDCLFSFFLSVVCLIIQALIWLHGHSHNVYLFFPFLSPNEQAKLYSLISIQLLARPILVVFFRYSVAIVCFSFLSYSPSFFSFLYWVRLDGMEYLFAFI